jgi:hypothetical protein
LGRILAPCLNQLPDNLKKLVSQNQKSSAIESKIIDSENKEIKIEKSSNEIILSVKKEEKMIQSDDDTDDNYDGYEDEFENEETNSQMNMKDNDTNMEDKENVQKEFQRKKIINCNTKIDDIDDTLFTFDEELAVNRIIEHRIENEIKKKKEFALWKLKKDLENKLNEEKNVRLFIITYFVSDFSFANLFLPFCSLDT